MPLPSLFFVSSSAKIRTTTSTDLTLTLDSHVVEQAEVYARTAGKSLSALMEDALKALTAGSSGALKISPDIMALMRAAKLPEGVTYEQVRDEYLTNKYQK